MCKRKSLFVIGMLFLSMVFTGCERAAVSDSNGMELIRQQSEGRAEPEGEAEEENAGSWANHYYNKGIYVIDNRTYRQFEDGLYQRNKGDDNWTCLCEIPVVNGGSITRHGEVLYFTCYQKENDSQEVNRNNSIYFLDINTQECGELLALYSPIYEIEVYNGCLYLKMSTGTGFQYTGYQLDEMGMLSEKLDETSEEFLCYEQNQYEERALKGTLKQEVISLPNCLNMLKGKILLRAQKDELQSSYYLKNVETGEETYLFDAQEIVIVTDKGIYYEAADKEGIAYYSFEDGTILYLEKPDILKETGMWNASSVTYDERGIYCLVYLSEADSAKIVRMSYDGYRVEDVIEGEELLDNWEAGQLQVDEEYLYLGNGMYKI